MAMVRARRPLPVVARRLPLLACSISVLLVSACGKSLPEVEITGPSEPTAPLTEQDFLVRANLVCRQAERQIAQRTEDIGPTQNDTGSRDAQVELQQAIEPVGRRAVEVLRNLTPPPEDAAMVRAGVDKMAAYLDRGRDDPTISLDPIGLADRQLYDYGLIDCFSAGPTTGTTAPRG